MARVVLVGPPGAGKSTIGRRLSSALNCAFVDTDQLIEETTGLSCAHIISEQGESAFRIVEAEQVSHALHRDAVVSLGGGAVITASTRELLAEEIVVFLDVSVTEGVRRTSLSNDRPLLHSDSGEDPIEKYRSLVESRRGFYREVSDFRVRTSGRTPQQIVGEILGFLETL